MRQAIFFAVPALMLSTTAAARDCNPAFADRSQSVTIRAVEIDARAVAVDTAQLRVVDSGAERDGGAPDERGGGPCAASLRVSRVDGTAHTGFPDYLLRAPGNPDVEILATNSQGKTARSDIRLANLPSGSQGRAVPLQFVVPTEWGLKAGTHSEQLLVSLYDEDGALRDETIVNLTIAIPPAVSVRIVGAVGAGSPGGARIDLGDLSPTAERRSQPFAARILSTTPYGVSFRSDNLGALAHVNGRGRILYRLYYNGRLVDLGGANFFPEASHTSAAGDHRRLQVVVPPIAAEAGIYRDRVTILVAAI